MVRRTFLFSVVTVGVLLSPTSVQAQDQARYLAGNIAIHLGGSLLRSVVTGSDFDPLKSLIGSTVGGTLSYTGQRLIGSGRDEFRFVGLQTAAFGASVSRSISDGKPALSDLTFPIYPFYLRVKPGSERPLGVQLSVLSLVSALTFPARWNVGLDMRETLITGAPVFSSDRPLLDCAAQSYDEMDRCGEAWLYGRHEFGVIAYADALNHPGKIITHEAGHIAQHTRDVILNALPASDALLGHLGMEGLSQWVALDVFLPMNALNHAVTARFMRVTYYEWESDAMMGINVCEDGYPGC